EVEAHTNGQHYIGRVTVAINPTSPVPAGQIDEFPLPAGAGACYGITTGLDKNLWVTDQGSGKTYQIDPLTAQVLNTFATPSATGITTGSDGNIWFTEYQTNKVGRIDSHGVVKEF